MTYKLAPGQRVKWEHPDSASADGTVVGNGLNRRIEWDDKAPPTYFHDEAAMEFVKVEGE